MSGHQGTSPPLKLDPAIVNSAMEGNTAAVAQMVVFMNTQTELMYEQQQKHNALLEAKQDDFNVSLKAKQEEYNASLEAKQEEFNASLEAKQREFNASLEAKQEEYNVELGQRTDKFNADLQTYKNEVDTKVEKALTKFVHVFEPARINSEQETSTVQFLAPFLPIGVSPDSKIARLSYMHMAKFYSDILAFLLVNAEEVDQEIVDAALGNIDKPIIKVKFSSGAAALHYLQAGMAGLRCYVLGAHQLDLMIFAEYKLDGKRNVILHDGAFLNLFFDLGMKDDLGGVDLPYHVDAAEPYTETRERVLGFAEKVIISVEEFRSEGPELFSAEAFNAGSTESFDATDPLHFLRVTDALDLRGYTIHKNVIKAAQSHIELLFADILQATESEQAVGQQLED